MIDMALLVREDSRIEGPQRDVLHVMFGSLVSTLEAQGMSEVDADNLASRILVRLQSRLSAAGFVVRDW